jgi:GT2 family glycosyltransferase
MPAGLISILIVNWNTKELLLQCLDSIGSTTSSASTEVIVVDNGSDDGSAKMLAERTDVILIRNDRNLGFAAAVNQAYSRSTGEFVLLLNSDVVLNPGALQSMKRFLDQNPSIAGVAPLYVFPDGSPQPFHYQFPTFSITLANCSELARRLLPGTERRLRRFLMVDEDFSAPRRVPQPAASCLLLRRSVLHDEHLLDERYPIFFNDVQFARELAAQGKELWVTPEATVVHEAHASTRMLGTAAKRQYLGSTVRMLMDTEPSVKVWIFRIVIFAQHVPMWVLARRNTIGVKQLWNTLAGDVGPLPNPGRPTTQ